MAKAKARRDDWTVADLKSTFEHLVRKENVDSKRIGIVGHCWGGRVAWLGACHLPDLAACAIFYGGRIKLPMEAGHAFQNFPAPERYREAQSEDAWEKVLGFLAKVLQRSG